MDGDLSPGDLQPRPKLPASQDADSRALQPARAIFGRSEMLRGRSSLRMGYNSIPARVDQAASKGGKKYRRWCKFFGEVTIFGNRNWRRASPVPLSRGKSHYVWVGIRVARLAGVERHREFSWNPAEQRCIERAWSCCSGGLFAVQNRALSEAVSASRVGAQPPVGC